MPSGRLLWSAMRGLGGLVTSDGNQPYDMGVFVHMAEHLDLWLTWQTRWALVTERNESDRERAARLRAA